MLLLLLVVSILFLVILIDKNKLKSFRNLYYFIKLNSNLKSYQYIYFCYNLKNDEILKNALSKYNMSLYFIKKFNGIKYLKFLHPFFSNSLYFICTNNLKDFLNIYSSIQHTIIFTKFNNNFYSLNNLLFTNKNTVYYVIISILYNKFISLILLSKQIIKH